SVLAELEADAGEGSLTSPQLAGGTFTIISVAQHAVTRLTPVIHAGQAAMLALGGISHTGVVATLACDHRIVSVHEAAAFLARVSALFEDG
ncbi:MAG TPA: 2-oxo acid dehydrogenase subunit E2, partial [Solirubrobacterales bacterium]|nr:2-oxo acid dehydrogenase subunit E2 [Solirubrobacterales bacterium]